MSDPWEDYKTVESAPWEDYKTAKKQQPKDSNTITDIYGGQLDAVANVASNIGYPFAWAAHELGLTNTTADEHKRKVKSQFSNVGADKDSTAYKTSKLIGDIETTAPIGGMLGKGASMIGLPGLESVLASGGFNIGRAATGNIVADSALRAGAGAIGGAAATSLVDPSNIKTGATIGAITPGVVGLAGKAGHVVNSGIDRLSRKLVNSALKPSTIANPLDVDTAISTILNNGLNVSRGGASKLQNMIRGTSQEVDSMVNGASGNVSKQDVLKALDRSTQKFSTQATPTDDLKAIQRVRDEFDSVWPDKIPVPVAHKMKKGTYEAINSKNYGELSGASTEAQKDLARGLKEGVENIVSGVKDKNKALQEYMTTMQFLDRAAGRETNKDVLGLALLAPNPEQLAAMELSRNALLKSLAARGIHGVSKGLNMMQAPQYGLLNSPSLLSLQSAE